jgi:peptide/nickel transport system substrate-binding protein
MKKVFAILVVLLVCAFIITGCKASQPATTPTPAQPAPATPAPATAPSAAVSGPQYGGILKVLGGAGGANVNFGWPPEGIRQVLPSGLPAIETLIREDVNLKLQPFLATAWQVAPDKSSITFNLRQGVKFHDGTDFNADAVKFNLDAEMEAKQPAAQDWKSVDVIDNYTVRINLSHWDNSILSGLAWMPTGMMVSPTAIKTHGKDWAKTHPVGTGPFKFVSWTPDVSLEYTKFEDYWQKDKPYLDGIKFISTANPQAALLAFQAGEGDLITSFDAKIMGDLKAMGAEMIYMPDGAICLHPDDANADSPFSNVKVRQALEYAIDREAIGKTLGYGFFNAAYQWARPGAVGYIPDLDVRKYDPAKAKQLLAEAGYPNGFKCQLGTNIYPNHSQAIQGYLKEVGIDASIWDLSAPGAYANAQTQGYHDALFIAAAASFQNMLQSVQIIYMQPGFMVSSKGPANLKQMYDDAVSTLTVEPAKVEAICRAIHDEASIGPVVYCGIARAASPKVEIHDIGYLTLSDIVFMWTPENVWIKRK